MAAACRAARRCAREFWKAKFQSNRERDERLERAAAEKGWQTLTIWGCETRESDELSGRLTAFLGDGRVG